MATIAFLTVGVPDAPAAERFYSSFGPEGLVRVRPSDEPTSGFRGFTLSLISPQPADVDAIIRHALDAGATVVKPAAKSLWGYGGVVQAPEGTIWTVASSSKKSTGPGTGRVDEFVLQLGVEDVAASERFYADRGFTVGKSYGRRYVEFDTGAVKLTLNPRRALAKTAGVPVEGGGSHRLVIGSSAGPFTDPDGYVWEAGTGQPAQKPA
jgi:uncharacterized glyoxalase superfamily protein PhnB